MKYTFLSILIFIRNAEVFIMKCHSIMNISQNGFLEKILSQFIDGFAFSHLKQRWSSNDVDINKLYDRYYSIMIKLVKSNLFSGLATLILCSVLEHIRQRTIVIIIKSLLVNFIREACMLKRAAVLQ